MILGALEEIDTIAHFDYSLGISAIVVLVVYPMLIRYSRKLTLLVFKAIPAEPLYGLFLAIVVLLAYYDAGLRGVLGVFIVSIVSGILWRNVYL